MENVTSVPSRFEQESQTSQPEEELLGEGGPRKGQAPL